jgi:hypothetical protein
VVSCTPFQVIDSYDASSCDLESDGFLEEPLDVLDPSFNGKNDDAIKNIDDFICVGRCKWDMSCPSFDGDPVCDIKGCFELHATDFQPSSLFSSFQDPVGNCVLHDDLSIGQGCFQLKVCCINFLTHMKRQHALGCENIFFSRLDISSSSFMGNCMVFFRLLWFPSRYLGNILVVEDEDQPSPICCIHVQGWIDQACEDVSFHDLVSASYLHELNSMIECSVVFVSTHDHFVPDLSLMWLIIKHKSRHFDKMLG